MMPVPQFGGLYGTEPRPKIAIEVMKSNYPVEQAIECLKTSKLSLEQIRDVNPTDPIKDYYSKIPSKLKKYLSELTPEKFQKEIKFLAEGGVELNRYISFDLVSQVNDIDGIQT